MNVTVTRDSTASAQRLWEVVTDWAQHGSYFPLTTIDSPDPGAVGQRFVGVTRFGPVTLHDPMIVDEWQPPVAGQPGRCVIRKTGEVLGGITEIVVRESDSGSSVTWTTSTGPANERLRRLLGPVSALSSRGLYGRVLTGLVRTAETS